MITGLSVNKLVKALNESAETDGRTMLLKNPATRRLSEREVSLPRGKLGEYLLALQTQYAVSIFGGMLTCSVVISVC
jgi:hypothetical protein